jgi:hypothetical protein
MDKIEKIIKITIIKLIKLFIIIQKSHFNLKNGLFANKNNALNILKVKKMLNLSTM